jgi:integrase
MSQAACSAVSAAARSSAAVRSAAGQAPPTTRRLRRDRTPALRHGAATMLLAAGQPPKVVSEVLGHSSVSFTMDVYTEVAEELAESAASAIAAFVPRNSKVVPARAKSVPKAAANHH